VVETHGKQPPALISGIFGGIKGALRIPSLSFQYPRRPGCTAKLLCFLTHGGFESHLVHQIPNDLALFHRLKSKDYGRLLSDNNAAISY
jgi:hypothetical protein